MSDLIHLIVSSDLAEKLQEKLGDDYGDFAKEIDSYIERTVNGRMKNETPYGLHSDMVGLFEVHFPTHDMAEANTRMKEMEHALKNCFGYSIAVNANLTYKITKGDVIESE